MEAAEPMAAWLWLGGSLLLSIVWSNLAWLFRQPRFETANEFITRLTSSRFAPWLFQFLRLLYYVGLPYGALLWGHDAVIASLLGLGGRKVEVTPADNWLDWAYDVGWGAALGIVAWSLLALGWWAYRRALAAADVESTPAGANVSAWTLLREAAFHQIHWAFYRNAPIVTLGAYWGTWSGLALTALEAALNPAWRKSLADPQKAPAQLMLGALAVVSGLLFWQTENLWLAVLLHWGVSWGLALCARRKT